MKVRLATLVDIEAIAALAGQLGYPTSSEEMGVRLLAILERPDQGVYVATGADGAVVGWVHVFLTHRLVAESFAEIGGLVVDEPCRARGVGRALIEMVEAWSRERGYSCVRVRSNTVRVGAFAFYERLGYQCVKTQNVFVKAL